MLFVLINAFRDWICAFSHFRCGFRYSSGWKPDQTQSGGVCGRAGADLHEVSEHLQNHRDQIQARRAVRGDHGGRQKDHGLYRTERGIYYFQAVYDDVRLTGFSFFFFLSLSADYHDYRERQTCAETDLGRQRVHDRERGVGWEINSCKDALWFSTLKSFY